MTTVVHIFFIKMQMHENLCVDCRITSSSKTAVLVPAELQSQELAQNKLLAESRLSPER